MLTDERMMAEIRDANLSYLILAQSLIRKDPVQALYRLGISEETAELVDQLLGAAASNGFGDQEQFDVAFGA